METLSWPQAEVPEPIRLQVSLLLDQMGPPGGRMSTGPHHDPALRPRCMALLDDGQVLAALYILSKELDHGGHRYAASGLSTVVTDRAVRRRGHGRRLIVAARKTMGTTGADLAIFTCDAPLAPFYQSGGYQLLPGTVLVGGVPDDPLPSDRFGKVTLWHPFSRRVATNSSDFRGATVHLYPGTIDRLW